MWLILRLTEINFINLSSKLRYLDIYIYIYIWHFYKGFQLKLYHSEKKRFNSIQDLLKHAKVLKIYYYRNILQAVFNFTLMIWGFGEKYIYLFRIFVKQLWIL